MAELSPVQQALIEETVDRILADRAITIEKEDIIPLIKDELEQIETTLKQVIIDATAPLSEPVKQFVHARTRAKPTRSHAYNHLAKYGSPGNARKPTMMIGTPGSGKTTVVEQFMEEEPFDVRVKVNGSVGVDAFTLLGGQRAYGANFIQQDGWLAYSMRSAAQGKKTGCFIDEYFRIKARDRSVFIPALSPIRRGGDWFYIFPTDRILGVKDGLATELEIIEAPCHMLSFFAATNVGAAFDVEMADPAEAARWVPYDLNSTEEVVREIIIDVLKVKGFNPALVTKFVKVLTDGRKLKADNFLMTEPDVRILSEAIKFSDTELDIGNTLLELAMVWVGRNVEGFLIPEQMEQLRKLIGPIFPLKKK